MKVHIDCNADGYIQGWGTDYTDDNMVEVPDAEITAAYMGACKLVAGHIVTDTAKQAELVAAEQATPSVDYDAEIAALKTQLAEAQQATLELADMMLGGDSDATTSAS